MNKAEIFWDKQSVKFEKQIEKDIQSFTTIIGKAKKHFDRNDNVLDFACGIGTSTIMISEYVKSVLGIDISSQMLAIANKRIAEKNISNAIFSHMDVFDNKLENESYNIITAFNILHLLEEPENAIKRLHDLLNPGGLFISTTAFLGERSLIKPIFYIISKLGMVPNLQLFQLSELELLIKKQQFHIIESERLHRKNPIQYIVAQKIN